jgi:hypothetical protein
VTPAQREALVAIATPEAPEDRTARIRKSLERHGLLGLVAEVALAHQVELDDVLSHSRVESIADARHVAFRRAYRERFFSCAQIGQVFDVDDAAVTRIVHAPEVGLDEPIPYWPTNPDEPVPYALSTEGEAAAAGYRARVPRPRPSHVARKRPRRAAHAGRGVAA